VLPDTQVYSLRYPGVFDSQTAWIARNVDTLAIHYVFHLGDIVNNNTDPRVENAASSMALLDEVVPYILVPGNHDYGPSGDASTRDGGLNRTSRTTTPPASPASAAPTARALDNTYHLFDRRRPRWIALALEWGPRDEVIAWANDVMQQPTPTASGSSSPTPISTTTAAATTTPTTSTRRPPTRTITGPPAASTTARNCGKSWSAATTSS
jgi:hypothetical protein